MRAQTFRQEIALDLDRARRHGHTVSSFQGRAQGLDVAEAYEVQQEVLSLDLARGEHRMGFKLGFTSRSKMVQMGVSEVIVGQLTDRMRYADAVTVDLATFVQPKIEPEIAFLLGAEVPVDDTAFELRRAVVAVAPAMEIIDSRYTDYAFSYTDVIADNTSAAGYVIGAWQPPCQLANRAVRLEVASGADLLQSTGSTAAILGDPWRSLDALLPICRKYGLPLGGHQVVLAGAATAALPFSADGVRARCEISGLGSITLKGSR